MDDILLTSYLYILPHARKGILCQKNRFLTFHVYIVSGHIFLRKYIVIMSFS